jgi:sarcosine oxidase subunit gamma
MAPEAAAIAAVRKGLQLALPTTPNRLVAASSSGRLAMWLGPDEWLIVDGDNPATVAKAVASATAAHGGTVVDVSAHRTLLELRGPRVPDLLAFGTSVDLGDGAFPVGTSVQTLLARVDVIIGRGAPETWHVAVRASFARYLVDWLQDALVGIEGDGT